MTVATKEAGVAPVSRISHLSLTTPRLDAMISHYTEVLGLTRVAASANVAHLACSDGTVALELIAGDRPSLDHLAFDLHRDLNLGDAARSLERAGITAASWTDDTAGDGESLRLTDPDGAVIQLMSRPEVYTATNQPHATGGVQPFKLGHVASRVDRIGDVVSFYEKALGFRYSDSIGDNFVFLRCNADHHSVNFLRAGAPRNVHHFAFELQDWAHVKTTCDHLWSFGIPIIWGPGRHGPGHNLYTYHRDPDNNIVELFAELDRMSDETSGVFDWRPWHDGPQRPRRWDPSDVSTNPWGNLPPDGMLM